MIDLVLATIVALICIRIRLAFRASSPNRTCRPCEGTGKRFSPDRSTWRPCKRCGATGARDRSD